MRCRTGMQGFGKVKRKFGRDPLGQRRNGGGSCLQVERFAGFHNTSMDANRLCHHFEERFLGKRLLMEVGEQEDCGGAVEVICREDGWDASVDATHCAVPMDFAASRVHHSQITLAVYDLTCQFENA